MLFITFSTGCLADNFEDFLTNDCSSDMQCIEYLKNESSDQLSLKTSHMSLAMRKGFWKCAKEIILSSQLSGTDRRNVFDMESRLIMKEISGLKSAVESSLPMSSISPAFQWAQSPTEIFINVKFAHKIDAPATLNVEASNVTLKEAQLYLQASDGRKNFVLDVEFLNDIIPNESTWTMASVGRMVFTLKKSNGPSKWTRLLKTTKKYPQMHAWWELQEKHRDELDKLDEDGGNSLDTKKQSSVIDDKKNDSENSTTADSTPKVSDEVPIETPEEAARKTEKLRIEKEAKIQLKELDDDIKRRKRQIDIKAKEDKELLDAELVTKKEEIMKKKEKDLENAENSGKTFASLGDNASVEGKTEL